jgi:hypothetical protein
VRCLDYNKQIAKFELELAEIKAKHGINTIKWQEVPRPSLKLNGYEACIEYLASQIKNVNGADGKSIVAPIYGLKFDQY